MDLIPTRIVVNVDGYARPPKPGDKIDVVFIRNDGWSLGAPNAFRHVAKNLWEGHWKGRIEFAPTLTVPAVSPK